MPHVPLSSSAHRGISSTKRQHQGHALINIDIFLIFSRIRSNNLQYNMGRWDKQLVAQASDVLCIIFFYNFLQIFRKNPFIFLSFYNNKIESFECPKPIRNCEKKTNV